jgi:small nuclear ribonucleoprotein (snRNP)-like protein
MSSKRWMCGPAAALVMMTAAGRASAESPEPADQAWTAQKDHAVVVEKQDGSLVAGKLVVVESPFVEVLKPDGSRAVVERSAVKALRLRLRDEQVIVTMKEKDETIEGKLAESDAQTIVVVTDDGRRVTLDRASIQTVRERSPRAPAAAPPAASGTGRVDRASEAKEPSSEERPSTGGALLAVGAGFIGAGLGTMAVAPLCSAQYSSDPSSQSTCVTIRLGIGGAFAGLGTLLLVGGVVQRVHFVEWKRQHGTFAFVPTRAGGTVTWQQTF